MNILLDTNILLWSLYKPEVLSNDAFDYLKNNKNNFYYSIVTLWEVQIKHLKNCEKMPITVQSLENLCFEYGIRCVDLSHRHIFALSELKLPKNAPKRKDPFDKILLCQAMVDNYTFLTHDAKLPNYGLSCVKFV